MLSPEIESELRTIVRSEVDAVIGAHFRDFIDAVTTSGIEPLMTAVAQLLNSRKMLEQSMGLVVESQARCERAVADATGQNDADEPWRASLDDVTLDDSDD